jgi:tetratricopeptide (TPR) repeat protein
LFVTLIGFTVLGLYVFSTYFFPRKLEEIAQMIANGQTKLAIKKLTDILEKDDSDPYAHYLLGEAYSKDGNAQYAVLEYRQVLKFGAYDERIREADVRSKLAKIFLSQKKINDAKNEFLILTKIEPDNPDNYFQLGLLFFNSNVFDKALPYFRKNLALDAKNSQSYYYIGQIHYRAGAMQDAKNALIQTIKQEQDNYKAHYFLGLVLRQLGDYEWAIKEFEIAQKGEDIRTKCFLAKGTCFLEKEQFSKAVIEFERGLKFASRGSDTELNLRYFLGDAHEKLRDMHSAIAQWEKVYEINKSFRDVEQKLKKNAEFRQDDRIKDFMIASLSNFEHLSRKIVENLGLVVHDVKIKSDTDIEIYASDKDDSRLATRKVYKLVRILRTTETISDAIVRNLHESIRSKNAQRLVVITTGDFAPAAMSYANTRPVDLFGKTQLVDFLRDAM